MKPVVITEYERMYYAADCVMPERREGGNWHLPRRLLERLRAFDEGYATKAQGIPVFDWSARNYVKAKSHVGVIQVPGLTVEILPKIDSSATLAENEQLAQDNLLYMLAFTRNVPLMERDLAALSAQTMPLLDALIGIFAERLLAELLRGVDHAYVQQEDNLVSLKGKLLFSQQVSRNAAHKERVFVGYDDFMADTWPNRILKACSWRLMRMTASSRLQKRLREVIALFDDVSDREIGLHDFDRIHLTRNNERFRSLLEFCRMVLFNECPASASGERKTFSLLFPMEQLFEEFIAAFISRNAADFGLERGSIHAQAKGRQRHLLMRDDNSKQFWLKPDIVIDRTANEIQLIIDTKWKHLKTSEEDVNNGILQSDIYQLYAYAHRYQSQNNVLLYPRVDGVPRRSLCLVGTDGNAEGKYIYVEFVDLHRNLRQQTHRLKDELREIITRTNKPEHSPGDKITGQQSFCPAGTKTKTIV